MKIIHRGTHPAEQMYRSTCNVCKSIYEYKAGDHCVNRQSDWRDGDFLWFKCQVCGNKVTQNSNQSVRSFGADSADAMVVS